MDYIGAAISDIGLVKILNQDSACLRIVGEEKRKRSFFMAVCDGVSSLREGEKASADAIRLLLSWYDDEVIKAERGGFKLADSVRSMIEVTERINRRIYEDSLSNGFATGTTMSCMAAFGGRYVISHVGDSRIYHIRKHVIERLTIDQTLTGKRIREGIIKPENSLSDDGRHVLLQCVGGGTKITPEIVTGKIKRGDLFLACSDGIYNTVSDNELYLAFHGVDSDESLLTENCQKVINECKRRGECDNMTIAAIKSL